MIKKIYKSLIPVEKRHRINSLLQPQPPTSKALETIEKYGALFIHIPKTGGQSVSKTLFNHLEWGHKFISVYKKELSSEKFNNTFKFGFVRNPWDRLYSAYNFLKKGGISEFDAAWSKQHLADHESFESFVKGWVNKENIYSYIHFFPQFEFVCIKNKLALDYLGRFENFNHDFNHIANHLNLSAELVKINVSNVKKISYRDVYTEETKNIVSKVYKKDIELFEYKF